MARDLALLSSYRLLTAAANGKCPPCALGDTLRGLSSGLPAITTRANTIELFVKTSVRHPPLRNDPLSHFQQRRLKRVSCFTVVGFKVWK